MTERWLAQARVSRDTARFALPPSALGHRAGDVVAIETPEGRGHFRLDHVEQAGVQIVQAVRVEPGLFEPSEGIDAEVAQTDFLPVVPVLPIWLDLPLLTGNETPHQAHLAVTADPWPGAAAVFSSFSDNGYRLSSVFRAPAKVGVTESVLPYARPGVIDRGPALRVRLTHGTVSSSGEPAMLNGSNVAVIGLGGPDGWEVFQYAEAELVGENLAWRGLERHYRTGPASQTYDDDSYVHEVQTIAGVGLRPYAPVHVKARWAGADVEVNWIRRSRINGDSWAGIEVPLGEEVEMYQVKVFADGALKREATVTAPRWTYSQSERLADGVGTGFAVEVAQISMSFGAGPAARTTLS